MMVATTASSQLKYMGLFEAYFTQGYAPQEAMENLNAATEVRARGIMSMQNKIVACWNDAE